ncbi:MAG: RNA polymerase sigma factor [Planctomycetes bacterium]|nr:RNA polymerase sigma factor [Planctomycetota bacterium]
MTSEQPAPPDPEAPRVGADTAARIAALPPPGVDTKLMLAARRGDNAALEALVARNWAGVVRFARGKVNDVHRAEDIAQETFLRLTRAKGRFERRGRFKSYLLRITTNLCLNEARRTTPLSSAEADGVAERGPQYEATCTETRELVRREVMCLPSRQRQAVLCQLEGLSLGEVAERLGLSEAATKSLLHRARTALRSSLWPQREAWQDR